MGGVKNQMKPATVAAVLIQHYSGNPINTELDWRHHFPKEFNNLLKAVIVHH